MALVSRFLLVISLILVACAIILIPSMASRYDGMFIREIEREEDGEHRTTHFGLEGVETPFGNIAYDAGGYKDIHRAGEVATAFFVLAFLAQILAAGLVGFLAFSQDKWKPSICLLIAFISCFIASCFIVIGWITFVVQYVDDFSGASEFSDETVVSETPDYGTILAPISLIGTFTVGLILLVKRATILLNPV